MKHCLVLHLLLAPLPAHAETLGTCHFDSTTLSFAGTPVEQAECLMQQVGRGGALSARPLPDILRHLLAGADPPTATQRDAALAALPQPYGAYAREVAGWPASQTAEGAGAAYFVLHDTSMPFLGDAPFPPDLDDDDAINDLSLYLRAEPVAHIFLNRRGQIWAGHDFWEPWRATKLESYYVGKAAKGRFLHIETVQPRRYAPGSTSLGDTLGPEPGFSPAQYRMLAALYVYASARAGRWLIPAQHATVDGGLPDAHDDPQNFDVERFARALEALLR